MRKPLLISSLALFGAVLGVFYQHHHCREDAIDFAGCREIVAGPICEIDRGEVLTFFVRDAEALETSLGVPQASQVLDGTRYRLELSATDTTLSVSWKRRGEPRRWRISLRAPATHAAIASAESAKGAGEYDRAIRVLDAAADLSLPDRARASGLRGRIAFARGEIDAALVLLARSSDEAASVGLISRSVDDALVRAYVLVLYARRLDEAREVLEEAALRSKHYADGRANLPYYFGLLARESGDFMTALELFEESERRALELGLDDLWRSNRQLRATTLVWLGRVSAAMVLLEEIKAGAGTDPCERADLLTNIGWAQLMAEDRRARGPIDQALALYRSDCSQSTGLANAYVNSALSRLLEGDANAAKAELAEAVARGEALDAEGRWWIVELEGRIALAEGRALDAVESFLRLKKLGEAAYAADVVFRAWLGEARAMKMLDRREAAIEAYGGAERVLNGESLAIPLLEARHGYLAARDRAAREMVELLVTLKEPGRALEIARRARARGAGLETVHAVLAELDDASRARWERAVGAYRLGRDALEREAKESWQLSERELALAEERWRQREVELRRALDDALLELSPRSLSDNVGAREAGREGAHPSAREAGGLASREGAHPSALEGSAPREEFERGELLLVFFPGTTGWLAFAASARGIEVFSVKAEEDLLEPLDAAIASARSITIAAYGAARAIDFHAARWRGKPLIAHAPVAYTLDLPHAPEAPDRATTALVVADPRGNLSAARREGELVAAALRARSEVTTLAGNNATRAALEANLRTANLLHYAGHVRYDATASWKSALSLAAETALSVGDILALTRVPRTIVLSSCEAARSPEGGGESIGVAQAFLLRGAREVVAAARPVSDDLGEAFVRAYYDAGDVTAAEATQKAQLTLMSRQPPEDWAAFRVLIP